MSSRLHANAAVSVQCRAAVEVVQNVLFRDVLRETVWGLPEVGAVIVVAEQARAPIAGGSQIDVAGPDRIVRRRHVLVALRAKLGGDPRDAPPCMFTVTTRAKVRSEGGAGGREGRRIEPMDRVEVPGVPMAGQAALVARDPERIYP